MDDCVFDRVCRRLDEAHALYTVLRHEPVFTSQEAADVRGTPLASGAKALICKGDRQVVMFVLPADLKLASREIRRARGWRKMRFLTAEEVLELTGLRPGSIPPFGSLFDLPTLCDSRLGENDEINFNAGDHSISVSMKFTEYQRVEQPELGIYGASDP